MHFNYLIKVYKKHEKNGEMGEKRVIYLPPSRVLKTHGYFICIDILSCVQRNT